MTRTSIDLDDAAVEEVMRSCHLPSKPDAVNVALRTMAGERMTVDEARAMRGSGWDGDLDAMRESHP